MQSNRLVLYQLGTACLGATTALNLVGIVLKIDRGSYIYAAFDLFVVLSFRTITWICFEPSRLAEEGFLACNLERWVSVSLIILCRTGYWIGQLNEATFVNGELMG